MQIQEEAAPAGVIRGADGKFAIIEANELESFGDGQTDAANTRIPYHSTFMQTADVRGADGKYSIIEANELEAFGDGQTDAANTRIPYHSTLL